MNIYLFEPRKFRRQFYPLTATRKFVDLQYGGFSLLHWWEKLCFPGRIHVLTEDYLQKKNEEYIEEGDVLIHCGTPPKRLEKIFGADILPARGVGIRLKRRDPDTEDEVMAVRLDKRVPIKAVTEILLSSAEPNEALARMLVPQDISWTTIQDYVFLDTPELLLKAQDAAIRSVVAFVSEDKNRQNQKGLPLDASNRVIGSCPVFIDEGASVSMAMLNTEKGPIYIGKDATVMEGAMIRGPLFLGAGSTVKMGARLYGPVVTGKHCVIGGELKNVIFHEGSNKGHDGYLGDSIIGSWCNFGAGSGGSNVKNTAGSVRLFDYAQQAYRDAGRKFGALVGDFTRIGVGTQLTTGSSIGVCCNLFGQQMPPALVRDFSWGTARHLDDYQFEQAIEHIRRWMDFKGEILTDTEIQILHHIFDLTIKRR